MVADPFSSPERLAAVAATGLVGTGPEEVFDDLATLAAQLLGAPYAFITIVDDEVCWWKSVAGEGIDAERSNPAEDALCHYMIGTGRPLVVEDARADERIRSYRSVDDLGIGAWAGFPVRSDDEQVVGSLCVVDTHARPWSEQDVRVLDILAAAAAREIALRSALAAEREASASANQSELRASALAAQASVLSESLQQALLPDLDPASLGIDAVTRYQPGEERLLLGGDLYDLARAPDGSIAFLIGDVAGHGAVPAAVGASLRAAWRALAMTQEGSDRWLDGLERLFSSEQPGDELFVTVLTGTISADLRTLSIRSAGHPPPLLRRAGGGVEVLEVTAGPPVGLGAPVRATPATVVALDPGWVLLLCTDGLFEGRAAPGAGERLGLDAVARRFGELVGDGRPTGRTLDLLLASVVEANGGPILDDVAVLLLQEPHRGADGVRP